MTGDKQTVSGEVASTLEWKSKKGSWVNLQDNANDFFAYAGKVPKVGETGTWTVKEGTGVMADKVELVKLLSEEKQLPAAKQKVPTGKTDMQQLMDKGDRVYFDKQDLIVRQTCIKAAAVVIGHAVPRDDTIKTGLLANAVIEVADKLYGWVTMRDEQLPVLLEDE